MTFDFDFAYALTMVFICFDLLRIHLHKLRTEYGLWSVQATKPPNTHVELSEKQKENRCNITRLSSEPCMWFMGCIPCYT